MCSISGYVTTHPHPDYNQKLIDIIIKAEERGRDSHGIVSSAGWALRRTGPPSGSLDASILPLAQVMINNNRAEPTTEWVPRKTVRDIQPFVYGGTIVAHNGTIANDAALRLRYLLHTESPIDSAVIPPLVERFGVDMALQQLIGSFALAIYHDGLLHLATNYKPLYLRRDDGVFYFSSLEQYLRESWLDNIIEVRPYSLLTIDPDTLAVQEDNLRVAHRTSRVLVIASGGLDSTVVATFYAQQGYEVTLLHFAYGCRAERREIQAVRAVAEALGCECEFMDLRHLFTDQIGGSRLTNTALDLVTERGGEASAELAHEWVPARNLVFYSIALAYAEAHHCGVIALGNNLEESGAYPDNEMIFAEKFNALIPHAINLNRQVEIRQPVGHLMKHEIVELGLDLGAPLDLTWSCYESGDEHCGTCGPCYMRKKAFAMNQVAEVVEYAR